MDKLNPSELPAYVAERLSAIERRLAAIHFDDPQVDEMWAYAVAGGRRIRPLLVVLSCEALGGALDGTLTGAVAVELSHKASVLHDDLVDEDTYRRGRLAFHAQFGQDQALLMGHLLISTAFRLLTSLQNSYSATTYYQLFSRMFFLAARGQLWDVASEGRDEILDLDRVLEAEYEKTGTLFELSTELGARLACVEPPTVERMALLGRKIGTAFQLLNDTNNLNGLEESTGRMRYSDLVRRKRTLILSYALATLPSAERSHLQALLAERLVTPDAIAQVAEILERSGAVDQAVRQARTWLREARNSLSSLPDSLARHALAAITRETIATATDWSELTASSPATGEP